ncbi:MAG: phosphoribosylformylglycinamidine cyclo-ligase [candidate division KSB1 bacterium]|nr:phosphoribosylformylglycinamidine cyclo-ligase [candidate division KSB1 bacterium]
MNQITYKSAGVDIAAAEASKKRIKKLAQTTFSPNVLRDIGLFGGFFKCDVGAYREPLLVSSVDGVGTKLKIAFATGIHNTVGEDLVNHCVNDIMTSGAVPLFFLDYLALGKMDQKVVEQVVEGIARGCAQAGCALVGGETAEMPGFYQEGEYDLAGTMVGVVEKEKIIDGRTIVAGDILLGLPSNGLHTNGYSLARKVLLEIQKYKLDDHIDDLGKTLGEELLRVHRSYQKIIMALKDKPQLKGMAHVTGGGIIGNTHRILPTERKIRIFWDNWEVPFIFQLIQKGGSISVEEMRRTFNMGIGYILIIARESVDEILECLHQMEDFVFIVGEVY